MANKTPCQTNGAQYNTEVGDNKVSITVDIPFSLNLSEEDASTLETMMHNAMELVLAPYWVKHDNTSSNKKDSSFIVTMNPGWDYMR